MLREALATQVQSLVLPEDQRSQVTAPLFGIEIEIENVHPANSQSFGMWTSKPDGSLRNNGREFVTPPVEFDWLSSGLTQFYARSSELGWTPSQRTGIHVHVDSRTLTLAQLLNWITAYTLCEPVLSKMVGEEREQSVFAIPFYRAPTDLLILHGMLGRIRETGDFRYVEEVNNSCKYSALNCGSLSRYGSLEFRHAPTWRDMALTFRWTRLLRNLRLFGPSYTPAQHITFAKENYVNYVQLMLHDCEDLLVGVSEEYLEKYDLLYLAGLTDYELSTYKARPINWGQLVEAIPVIPFSGLEDEAYAEIVSSLVPSTRAAGSLLASRTWYQEITPPLEYQADEAADEEEDLASIEEEDLGDADDYLDDQQEDNGNEERD